MRLAANLPGVGALGLRSVRQTFRRPQLIAPIIVFPTLLLAIHTGGAGGACRGGHVSGPVGQDYGGLGARLEVQPPSRL